MDYPERGTGPRPLPRAQVRPIPPPRSLHAIAAVTLSSDNALPHNFLSPNGHGTDKHNVTPFAFHGHRTHPEIPEPSLRSTSPASREEWEDDESPIEFASMNNAIHSILVAKRKKLATMSNSTLPLTSNLKVKPLTVDDDSDQESGQLSAAGQIVYEYLEEEDEELISRHQSESDMVHQTSGNKSNFSTSDAEVTLQRSWERDSLRSEIPPEVLSEMGLIFASKEAFTAQPPPFGSLSSVHKKKHSSQHTVFVWPARKPHKRRNPIVKTLLSAQGMFSTLYSLLNDVTGTHPLVSKIQVDRDTIEVAYANDGFDDSVLLFGLKVAVQRKTTRLASASRVLSHLKSAILFRWGTFERAFGSGNEQAMDHLLCNTLISLIDPKDFLFTKLPPSISLSPTIKHRLDHTLYQFETSTFNLHRIPEGVDAEASKLLFQCVGSFLLHKGRLLVSHLSANLQQQLYSNMMTELNLWRRDAAWESLTNLVLHTRAFLQIPGSNSKPKLKDCVAILAGTDYVMLGFILEPLTECVELTRHHTVLWIHKALRTVQHLAEQDYTMKINQMPERPVVSNMIRSASAYLVGQEKKKSNRKKGSKTSAGKGDPVTQLTLSKAKFTAGINMTSSPATNSKPNTRSELVDQVTDNLSSVDDDREPSARTSTTSSSKSRGSSPKLIVGRRRQKYSSERACHSTCEDEDITERGTLLKPISIMKENVLYHFVHLEFGRGYFLNSQDLTQSVFYSEIMDNFQASARVTHGILQRAAKARVGLVQNTNERKWLSHSLAPITEHGTMFQYWITKVKRKKEVKVKPISFWVVGRLYDESKEIFLCYRDGSIPENVVESAFKLVHSAY